MGRDWNIYYSVLGVLVGFRGDSIGEIRDLRPKKDCAIPSVNYLIGKNSTELKKLLIEGIEKQKEDLIEHKEQNGVKIYEVSNLFSASSTGVIFQ